MCRCSILKRRSTSTGDRWGAGQFYATHVALDGGDDRLVFDGNVVPGDFTRISGNGTLTAALSDPSVLVGLLGGEGVHVPALSGTAKLRFDGLDSVG